LKGHAAGWVTRGKFISAAKTNNKTNGWGQGQGKLKGTEKKIQNSLESCWGH